MKRIIFTSLALMLCLCLFALPVFATSASATLTGPGTVRAGDSVTLTFNLSGSNIFGASGTLSYDAGQLEFVGTSQVIGNGWLVEFNGSNFVTYDNNMANPINSSTAVFTATFKVKGHVAAGTAINVSCVNVVASDGNADANIGTVAYATTIAAPLSGNNDLGGLTVSNATISPAFSATTTSYTTSVPFDVAKLNVSATTADGKARVSVNNPDLVPGGTTNVTVTVTAENGSTKTYTIAVTRAQDPNYVPSSNNALAGITVDGFLLSPVFNADNTEYVVWLPYETESVTVSGIAADSKATVTVEGGSNLTAGADNAIKVICTAEDGTQKVYTVIAKRAAAHDAAKDPTDAPVDPSLPDVSEPSAEPQEPAEPEKSTGIPVIVFILVMVVCLAGGVVAGIFAERKYLSKK